MQSHHPIRELPIDQIVVDPDSAHHTLGTHEEEQQLRTSIERFGVISPLLVSEDGADRYLVIDGYRRVVIARGLGITTLFCVVHPPMEAGEREALRFSLYMTYKPLTQAERTKQRRRLRDLGIIPPGEAA